MKRNIIILFLLSFLFLFFIGCDFNNTDDELLKEVKAIEELNNKYANWYLTADDYIKKVKEVAKFTKEFYENRLYEGQLIVTYDPAWFLFPEAINMVKGKNTVLFTDEELKKLRDIIKPAKTEVEVQISKVYNEGGNKYIFSKGKAVTTYKGYTVYEYYLRKYTFVKEEKEWRIKKIDTELDGGTHVQEKKVTFRGEPVEFLIKFNPLEND